ncbi:MAG: hypothetical protein SVT52_07975 [Planctomycetota bacterium]|nr:hypothetical protein [Planctomycetota bacterium]
MTGDEGVYVPDFSAVIRLEEQLAESLRETADDLAHTEFFDAEQRAELYTILEAMRSDTELHHDTLVRLNKRMSGEVSHA